jgi:hypothetical protein
MKAWSVIGLLFAGAIFATIPISPQVTPRGVELDVDQAQAQITYGRYRRLNRRYYRRAYRRGYYGGYYGAPYYRGYGGYYGGYGGYGLYGGYGGYGGYGRFW